MGDVLEFQKSSSKGIGQETEDALCEVTLRILREADEAGTRYLTQRFPKAMEKHGDEILLAWMSYFSTKFAQTVRDDAVEKIGSEERYQRLVDAFDFDSLI